MVTETYQQKDFEVFGNGFGVLKYNNTDLQLVKSFRDNGQKALGNPIPVMGINDVRPQTIITSQAIGTGTLTFETYVKKAEGIWGTPFNGKFAGAIDLADLLNKQMSDGSAELRWITVDSTGAPTKQILYCGVVITDAQRNIQVDSGSGALEATFTFTCMYTRTIETLVQ